ncbi:MAG: thioesterase [Rhodospirillaceae bacterium]|jgi:acyl-CoA thioester hydrolase|nr:thioesterase [Rhodospirillaceae bacterium]MBT4042751.1 thioesterase [Rhodospirillaceae bacterium]MBT4689620.1 thioesterase [Rhodospirillaceae bacterium]MBT5082309.1 thioesterase [Rhodospirillaceae bacterium]MBT5525360.1 thioesterase [Rhodospirillaceae bacterium]
MTQHDSQTAEQSALEPMHGLHKPLRPGQDVVPRGQLDIHRARVLPEWIDYNGHLNMAYYVLMFDNATDRFFDLIDLGVDYVKREQHSAFVLETHVTYQQEVALDDDLRFSMQLIDADEKRLHYYFEMFHAAEGFLAATSEQIALHVDLEARRSAPFPNILRQRIDMVLSAHSGLARPDGVGRSIGIRRKS